MKNRITMLMFILIATMPLIGCTTTTNQVSEREVLLSQCAETSEQNKQNICYKETAYKTAFTIITGASSGIGEASAKALAEKGKNLILLARRKEKLQQIKKSSTLVQFLQLN